MLKVFVRHYTFLLVAFWDTDRAQLGALRILGRRARLTRPMD